MGAPHRKSLDSRGIRFPYEYGQFQVHGHQDESTHGWQKYLKPERAFQIFLLRPLNQEMIDDF